LFDDLNMSGALGPFFELLRLINVSLDADMVSKAQATTLKEELLAMDALFGFIDASVLEEQSLPEECMQLLEQRKHARENKDWAESDRLRDLLREKGVEVRDGKDGQTWKHA
jgi:cysteinyl-tRNA synthetase